MCPKPSGITTDDPDFLELGSLDTIGTPCFRQPASSSTRVCNVVIIVAGTSLTTLLAFAPTLKMMICIAIGYMITKRGGFPPEYGKGVSILSLVSAPLTLWSHTC
jgi:energy-converting hydrogenase Eha subunit E